MKCKVRYKDNRFIGDEEILKIHFDEDMYCFNPKIYVELDAILRNVILDADFPKREESKINHILALYFHQNELCTILPIFNNMYIVLRASHGFEHL